MNIFNVTVLCPVFANISSYDYVCPMHQTCVQYMTNIFSYECPKHNTYVQYMAKIYNYEYVACTIPVLVPCVPVFPISIGFMHHTYV